MIFGLVLPALISLQTPADPHQFVYLGAGRFAQYADMSTLQPQGNRGRIRALQVVEPGFRAGGAEYWGGWSWWAFDCDAGTVDRLDFASVRPGGTEGPAMPDDAPAYVAAQGGDAFELLVAACNPDDYDPDFITLETAVQHGRAQLAID